MPSKNPQVNVLPWTSGTAPALSQTSTGYVLVRLTTDGSWLVQLFVAKELNDTGWAFTAPAGETWRALEVPYGFSINNGDALAASLGPKLFEEDPTKGEPPIIHGRP
ncbi:MAG: hypothetical protein JWP97_4190 [Labilithrix sp.]|nr:hypothetical protein [Labilithrix sp.]